MINFKIKRLNLNQNLIIRLLSLLFAIFIWFFVVNEEKTEVNLAVPIEITNLPPDLIVDGIPPTVMITVYGPRSLVQIITGQKITKTINMENAQKGTMKIQLNPDSISLPSGARITRIQPSTLELSISKYTKKEVPVKLLISGQPHQDFKLVDSEVLPSKITIYGSEDIIEKVKAIETPIIDITNSTDSINRIVKLDFRENGFTSDISNLFIKIRIEPEKGNLVLSKIPITIDSDIEGVTYSPRYAEVHLEGPKNLLKNTKSEDIILKITVKGMEKGQHSLQPIPYIPNGLFIKEIKPSEFKVTIPDETKTPHEKTPKKDTRQR